MKKEEQLKIVQESLKRQLRINEENREKNKQFLKYDQAKELTPAVDAINESYISFLNTIAKAIIISAGLGILVLILGFIKLVVS